MFDQVIVNGKVYSGAGGPWLRADVGIKDGYIVEIGNLSDKQSENVIDADERVVCPGFIDIHSHSDLNLIADGKAQSKIRQGITTEVIGQCGNSAAPADPERLQRIKEQWSDKLDVEDIAWWGMDEYLDMLRQRGISVNCAPVVGHGSIRRLVMGEDDRASTESELQQMEEVLQDCLDAGSFGMSSGLIYPPGVYADTDELISLAEVLAHNDALYFTHIRNEGSKLIESLQEAVNIGAASGCRVQISHLKAMGEDNWGDVRDALKLLNQAREDGVQVTADQYPYTASATGLTASLPSWAHDGGRDVLLERLENDEVCTQIKEEMNPDGWEDVLISHVSSDINKQHEGKNIADIAEERDVEDPRETALQLLREEKANVGVVRFAINDEDVREVMKSPIVMVGTDGSARAPEGPLSEGKPHPRSYGTFPRVLGKYVRDEGVLSLSTAISKMTSLPASTLGLWDRGLLLPGFCADIVIFDPVEVTDCATFTDPHNFPAGIDCVLVNGQVVVQGDDQRDEFPGEVLSR